MTEKQVCKAEHIAVKFGDRQVLRFDRLAVYEGERIGLVGANGVGKTTLLRVLSGELKPEQGRVERFGEIGYFRQFAADTDETLPMALRYGRNENGQRYGMGGNDVWDETCPLWNGREVKEFQVKEKLWQTNVSGGEDVRIRLAQIFGRKSSFLLLDEPTSNLDRSGIALLTERLKRAETLIVVSHDRTLLNDICTRIIELEDGNLTSYDGNYDAYTACKEAAKERQQIEYEQYRKEKRRLENVCLAKKQQARKVEKRPRGMSASDRKQLRYNATRKPEDKARSMERAARNVEKRIEHMEVKEKPKEQMRISPEFRLHDAPENRVLIEGEHLTFSYDKKSYIFRDTGFAIKNKSRVAVVGANGAGKTTLLRLIEDSVREETGLPLETGRIRVVPKARLGVLEQNLSRQNPEKTALETVMERSVFKEDLTRIIMARLLLSEKDIKKKVRVLSGGERIKLAFASLLAGDVNVLVLDEPTNYLDLPSIEELEKLLSVYEGTLVFVSHDEAFIRAVATERLLVENGKISQKIL